MSPPGGAPSPFDLLVAGLAGQVHVGLGLRPDPVTQGTAKDLASARRGIDILAMLEEKTRGNLSAEESRLLGAILAELRLAYVRASR